MNDLTFVMTDCYTSGQGFLQYDLEVTVTYTDPPATGTLTKGNLKVGTRSYSGYLKCTFKRKEYYVHRICWYLHHGYWPTQIDHINHDRADNRIENLREVNSQQNNMNQSFGH